MGTIGHPLKSRGSLYNKRIKNSKGSDSIYYNKEPLDMAQVSPYLPLLLYKVDNFHNLEANMQTKTEA